MKDLLVQRITQSTNPAAEFLSVFKDETYLWPSLFKKSLGGNAIFTERVILSFLHNLTEESYTEKEQQILIQFLRCIPVQALTPSFLQNHIALLLTEFETANNKNKQPLPETAFHYIPVLVDVGSALQKASIILNTVSHPNYEKYDGIFAEHEKIGPLNISGLGYRYDRSVEPLLEKAFKIYALDQERNKDNHRHINYALTNEETFDLASLEEFKEFVVQLQSTLDKQEIGKSLIRTEPGYYNLLPTPLQHQESMVAEFLKSVEKLSDYSSEIFNNFYTASIDPQIDLSPELCRQIVDIEKSKETHQYQLCISSRTRAWLDSLQEEDLIDILKNQCEPLKSNSPTPDNHYGYVRYLKLFSATGALKPSLFENPNYQAFLLSVKNYDSFFWANSADAFKTLSGPQLEQVLIQNPDIYKRSAILGSAPLEAIENPEVASQLLTAYSPYLERVHKSYWTQDTEILKNYFLLQNVENKNHTFNKKLKKYNKDFFSEKNLITLLQSILTDTLAMRVREHLTILFENPYFEKFWLSEGVQKEFVKLCEYCHQSKRALTLPPVFFSDKKLIKNILENYPNTDIYKNVGPLIYSQDIALLVVKTIVEKEKSQDYNTIKRYLPYPIATFLEKSGLKGPVLETLEAIVEKRKINYMLHPSAHKIEVRYEVGSGTINYQKLEELSNISSAVPSVLLNVEAGVSVPSSIPVSSAPKKTHKI